MRPPRRVAAPKMKPSGFLLVLASLDEAASSGVADPDASTTSGVAGSCSRWSSCRREVSSVSVMACLRTTEWRRVEGSLRRKTEKNTCFRFFLPREKGREGRHFWQNFRRTSLGWVRPCATPGQAVLDLVKAKSASKMAENKSINTMKELKIEKLVVSQWKYPITRKVPPGLETA